MVAVDLKERRPPEGSGKAAQAVNKREQHTIVGRVRKAWRRLTRPVSGTDQSPPGRVPPERSSAAKVQQRGEPSPGPPVKESAGKSAKPPSSGKERFQFLTLDELEALPDPEWLIEGILPQGGLAVLYGEPGAGKSFLALDWAMSIASGQPWFGRQVKAGAVVYIYAEGVSGLKYRARAWHAAKTGEATSVWFLPEPVDFVGGEDGKAFVHSIRKAGISPSLVIIDTLARCFGAGDENATRDMNAFVSRVDKVRVAFPRTTILVVHHQGKDPTRRDRGSTALRGAADTMMRLFQKKNKTLILSCDKQKDPEEFKAIHLQLRRVGVAKDRTSCVIDKADAKSLPKTVDPRALATNATALEALMPFGPKGASFTVWLKASGLRPSTFKDAMGRLVPDGGVIKMDNGRYVVAELGPGAGTGPEQGCPAAA